MGNADRLIAALSALAADAAARPRPPVNLTEAALRGDMGAVRAFLDGGAPVEERTIGFASPLAAAAGRGHLEVVRLLVERGASLDPEGAALPLLTFPIAHRRLDVVEHLLKAGATVEKYRPQLRQAVEQRHWDVVDALLAGGADPGWLSPAERAQLEAFVEREQPRSPRYRQRLREEQARRLERERVGPAPAPLAEPERARHESAAAAEVARDPALARARTGSGTPVLALAVSAGAGRLARVLLDAGADPDDGGAAETPLARAAARSDVALLAALLDAGAGPNRCGPGSPHPLLAAARAGCRAGVELLLQRGARPRARDLRASIEQAGGPDAAAIVARLSALQTPAVAARRRAEAEAGHRPQARPADPLTAEQVRGDVADVGDSVEGKVFAATGCFETVSQDEIRMSVEVRGGVFKQGISRRTHFLVAGAKAGAKLEQARAQGLRVLTEAQFRALCARIPITEEMKRRYLG